MNPDNRNTTPNLPKSLPYCESDSYIDSLVNRCTEQALAHEAHRPPLTHPAPDSTHLSWKALPEQVAEQDPIDALLNTLSTDELLQIDEPCPDEIPEY